MRILRDENIPLDLAAEFAGHQVETVIGLGWSGVSNGDLLRRAAGRFDAFVTMDTNLQYQENLRGISFGILLIRAPSNRMVHLRPLMPAVLAALPKLVAGRLETVGP